MSRAIRDANVHRMYNLSRRALSFARKYIAEGIDGDTRAQECIAEALRVRGLIRVARAKGHS